MLSRIMPGSGLSYRLKRIGIAPSRRNLRRAHIPFMVGALIVLATLSLEPVAVAVLRGAHAVEVWIEDIPPMIIRDIRISGAPPELERDVDRLVSDLEGRSILDNPAGGIEARIEALPPVRDAQVRFTRDRLLEITLIAETPAFLWRRPDPAPDMSGDEDTGGEDEDAMGGFFMITAEGRILRPISSVAAYPDLVILLGRGSRDRSRDAMALISGQPDLAEKVRVVQLMHYASWRLVLDSGLIIDLPRDHAEQAISGLMAHDYAFNLLSRDIARIDLRNPETTVVIPGKNAQKILDGMLPDLKKEKERAKADFTSSGRARR